MSVAARTNPQLPELPLTQWRATKDTLHLWVQIVGKVRMASTAPRNHWWHVTLYVGARGLTTRRMHAPSGVGFEIRFDFVDHRLVIETSEGGVESFQLVDGLSVAAFDEQLHAALGPLEIDVAIVESPFGVPITTRFPDDREHATYDPGAVERYWRVLQWTNEILDEFSGWYCGKTSPVHLFWHSLDLAVTRFSGRRAPENPDADPVTREAYTHEVVSFGFWAGDDNLGDASYYSYAAPEPSGLRERHLEPAQAEWIQYGAGSLAILRYDDVRVAADPRAPLLSFLESAYQAGAGALGWDVPELRSSWCPSPRELSDLLAGG